VGPSYVRDRDGSGSGRDLLDYVDAYRDPNRGQDFFVALHGLGRTAALYFGVLFAVAFVLQFTIGGLSGVMHASPPIDMEQTDSYIIVAHFHYVLGLGALFAIFCRILLLLAEDYRQTAERDAGKWHFWLAVWSFNATFFPMHFLGELGMPRRIYTYAPHMGWDFWNKWETWNAYIIALSFVPFLINILWSLSSGERAGADPWTRERWSGRYRPRRRSIIFAEVPTVSSRDAFWVAKYGEVEASGLQATPP